jgi:hypothetical protein
MLLTGYIIDSINNEQQCLEWWRWNNKASLEVEEMEVIAKALVIIAESSASSGKQTRRQCIQLRKKTNWKDVKSL